MKICIIGNSHVAAIKNAWDEVSCDHPSHELYFFAAPGSHLRNLDLVDCYLAPKTEGLAKKLAYTSGGNTHIDLNLFDAFIICGLELEIPLLDIRLSKAVINQTCQDILSNSLNYKICNLIRKQSGKSIYIFHNPQLAPSDFDKELLNKKLLFPQVIQIMVENLKIPNAFISPQPIESLKNLWHTLPKFAIGSTRLLSNEQHPELEIRHMNKDFGILWLSNFFIEIEIR